jgi:hypothetical protein
MRFKKNIVIAATLSAVAFEGKGVGFGTGWSRTHGQIEAVPTVVSHSLLRLKYQ